MKKFLFLCVIALMEFVASAQKVYFLYLQTEDFSPFYVRMANKIYSSASSGFLILPNLVDTTYYLSVGFAKSSDPETKFSVAVNQADRGFLIKKFDDGLALFDFEQLSVVKSASTEKDNTVYETKSDLFSNILSKAANDPSIVKIPVKKVEDGPKTEKKEEVTAKADESKPEEKPPVDSGTTQTETAKEVTSVSDSTAAVSQSNVDTIAVLQPAKDTATTAQSLPTAVEATAQETLYKLSVVSRHSESSTTEGFGIVYFDQYESETDTVRILIPSSKAKPETEEQTVPATTAQTKEEKVDSPAEVKKGETESKPKEDKPVTFIENKAVCKNNASDKDFLKLRKKMAAGDTDEEMVGEAKKGFRTKCYTVEQVRYLSTLFLTSAAKYQFFDAAYEHVSDKGNFASLGSEIKDEYYAKRFKALVGE